MGTNLGSVMTLANGIIGVSILAMPFCFKQCGIILSILMLLISNIISRLTCHFLLKSAIMTRRRTFEFLAFHAFGPSGKFFVEIGIIGFLLGTCIAYFVVIGDLGPAFIANILNLGPPTETLRSTVIISLALFCVLPLGLLRNVDSLSSVCTATIGFYVCLIVKIIIEALPHLLFGDWVTKVIFWRPIGILQCLPIFSMALCCQTQLFEIFDVQSNVPLDSMNAVIRGAVNICTAVYIFVGLFGYIAFCAKQFSGNILMSFTPSLATDVIKVGFVLSLAFSFPLVIFPCRASLHSLLFKKAQMPHEYVSTYIPEYRFKWITFIIVGISFVTGLLIPSIELVLGLVGSTIGIMICVIFPSTCFICITTKNTTERILSQIMLVLGILIMVLGTYANLYAIEEASIAVTSMPKVEPILPHLNNIDLSELIKTDLLKNPIDPAKDIDRNIPESILGDIKNKLERNKISYGKNKTFDIEKIKESNFIENNLIKNEIKENIIQPKLFEPESNEQLHPQPVKIIVDQQQQPPQPVEPVDRQQQPPQPVEPVEPKIDRQQQPPQPIEPIDKQPQSPQLVDPVDKKPDPLESIDAVKPDQKPLQPLQLNDGQQQPPQPVEPNEEPQKFLQPMELSNEQQKSPQVVAFKQNNLDTKLQQSEEKPQKLQSIENNKELERNIIPSPQTNEEIKKQNLIELGKNDNQERKKEEVDQDAIKKEEKETAEEAKINSQSTYNPAQELIEKLKAQGKEQEEVLRKAKQMLEDLNKQKEELARKQQIDELEKKQAALEIQKIANIAIEKLAKNTNDGLIGKSEGQIKPENIIENKNNDQKSNMLSTENLKLDNKKVLIGDSMLPIPLAKSNGINVLDKSKKAKNTNLDNEILKLNLGEMKQEDKNANIVETLLKDQINDVKEVKSVDLPINNLESKAETKGLSKNQATDQKEIPENIPKRDILSDDQNPKKRIKSINNISGNQIIENIERTKRDTKINIDHCDLCEERQNITPDILKQAK